MYVSSYDLILINNNIFNKILKKSIMLKCRMIDRQIITRVIPVLSYLVMAP